MGSLSIDLILLKLRSWLGDAKEAPIPPMWKEGVVLGNEEIGAGSGVYHESAYK